MANQTSSLCAEDGAYELHLRQGLDFGALWDRNLKIAPPQSAKCGVVPPFSDSRTSAPGNGRPTPVASLPHRVTPASSLLTATRRRVVASPARVSPHGVPPSHLGCAQDVPDILAHVPCSICGSRYASDTHTQAWASHARRCSAQATACSSAVRRNGLT